MFTEYIFENKKYENAVRDLKSILFDIVASENSKLSVTEAKVAAEINEERRRELEELCQQQNEDLKKVLEITGELSDSLVRLDSYSKALKQLEDENVAEMIASLGNRNIEKAYQSDIMQANKERAALATEMIQTASALNREEYPQEEMIENVRTIQQGIDEEEEIQTEQDTEDSEIGEESMDTTAFEAEEMANDELQSEFVEDGQGEEQEHTIEEDEEQADRVGSISEIETPEPIFVSATEEKVEDTSGVVEEKNGETDIDNSVEKAPAEVEPSISEEVAEQQESETVESDTVKENTAPEPEKEIAVVPVIAQPVNEVGEDLVSVADIDTKEEVATPATVESSNDKIQLPVIENVSGMEPIKEIPAVVPLTPTNVDLEEVSKTVDNQEKLVKDNYELAQGNDMNLLERLKFRKTNSNVTRAILTTKAQITNLRKSRETMKALYKVKRSVADIPVAEKTTAAVEKAIDDTKVTEQQLIDNGLLAPKVVDRQRQIEEMLEKANNLYKEGKAAEAQAMYDQISALNKEMQGKSRTTK